MEWQPIETAPKDQDILVWYDHDKDPYQNPEDLDFLTDYATWAESGGFMEGKGLAISKWFPQSWESLDEYGGGYYMPSAWFVSENDDYERVCNPTHWMPLPVAPED